MLSELLNVPHNQNDWNIWAFAHRDHHASIRQAIQRESNGADDLFEYELDPISPNEVSDWLSRNQQSHDDFNGVLNLQGTDLEGVDFKDEKQLEAWIYSHYLEHQSAAVSLGI